MKSSSAPPHYTQLREAQLSPLDQIRLAEAEVTRNVAAAREESEHTLTKAKTQARALLDEARQSGKRKGKTLYSVTLAKAEEEARAILAGADVQAEELHRKGRRTMDFAVRQVVSIVTGLEEDGTNI